MLLASACGQIPRVEASSSANVSKGESRFGIKRSISSIQPGTSGRVFFPQIGQKGFKIGYLKLSKACAFSRNPANSKGMAEARPVTKVNLLQHLIFGRSSAKAEKARFPKK
jgi:hypothetical protein